MSEATGIQAAIRLHTHIDQRGGNLLKAEVRNGHVDQAHVLVTFTGTLSNDRRTEFYQDKNERYGKDTYTLRCELGDRNWYYLCAEDDKVFLVKSVSKAPKDEKFMFQTSRKPVSDGGQFWTIKSLGTGKFLASDTDGNACLIDRQSDVYTWLKFLHPLKRESESFHVEEDTVFSVNSDSIHFTASYCQASEVEAC